MTDSTSWDIVVNGTRHELAAVADRTLLDVLREDLQVTGPKYGCGEGVCGACTVLVGSRAVQACQLPAAEVAGQHITTVEGLAEEGLLHPVQQAWLETGAMQCGYCTPGWLTATAGLLARVPHPTEQRIAAELAGHVCRCCCYPRIRTAVHRAAELMDQPDELDPVPLPQASNRPEVAPEVPWSLTARTAAEFSRAMPPGLLAVVAEGSGQDSDEAWVHVGADGAVTAFTGKVEEGQGTRTALRLLVAEELAVSPDAVHLTMAATDTSPFDWGTFGSRSMPHAAPPLRAAAAGALRVLRELAAARFELPPDALTAADGCIAGPDGAPSARYGELVAGSRQVERVPVDEPVRPAARWRVAGRPARSAGAADVVTGAKKFPSDLRMDGMLHGCVLHPPSAQARMLTADTSAAAAMPGVTVVADDDFIGVLAARPHLASAAVAAIRADWAEPAGLPDAGGLEAYLRAHPVDGSGWAAFYRHDEGDCETAFEAGPVRVRAHYSAAYVAHVPLEPRAALARWDGDRLVVWTATSTPFRARKELAEALRVPEADVQVVVPDFGGGFGGKHGCAVALEAARLARVAGQPVKVTWTRRDEFTAGYLRPAAFIDAAASTDAAGQLTSWAFTNVNSGSAGITTPYLVANQQLSYQPADSPLARGSYRALAATANNFARESLMDELAAAAGADPVEFRLRHLDDGRLAAVLRAAADEIGWGSGPGATGIALGTEKDGRVATAARVTVAPSGAVTIDELVTVVDCGAVVHPDGLVNQVEGAVMMGLGPALFEQIEHDGGRVQNASLASYRVPRLADLPARVRVVLLDQPDQLPVGGGEAPIIAVAPAIGNAIFRACGVRLRAMPLIPGGKVPGRPAAS
jgi:nicotinate dehydrogenase subunit B